MTFTEVKILIEGLAKTALSFYQELSDTPSGLKTAQKKILEIVQTKKHIINFYSCFNTFEGALAWDGEDELEKLFDETIQPIVDLEGKRFLVA